MPFLTSYLFTNPDYADITGSMKVEDFFDPMWSYYDLYKPLTEGINSRKIKIWGIEIVPRSLDLLAAKSILNKNRGDVDPLSIDWQRLEELFKMKFFYYEFKERPEMSIDQECELMRMIDEINNYTLYLLSKNRPAKDLKVILQWIRNINTAFSFMETSDSRDTRVIALPFRNRDSQMAENVLWINENYPKEKLIVWCANFHAAKDISQTTYPTDSLLYLTMQCMGEGIYNKLQDKAYMLAFTSLNKKVESGKLEQCIAESINDQPFGFIDFEPLRHRDGFRNQSFESSNIKKKEGKWLYIYDGMYYIRDQIHKDYGYTYSE